MKYIFLDIDGVLNSFNANTFPQVGEMLWTINDLDSDKIELLNNIIKNTQANIVISSSWRNKHSLYDLRMMFAERGFIGDIIGTTPKIHYNKAGNEKLDRGDEIRLWMRDRIVKSFIVIDDIEFDSFTLFGDKFILIEDHDGIKEHHADKAIQILNGPIV